MADSKITKLSKCPPEKINQIKDVFIILYNVDENGNFLFSTIRNENPKSTFIHVKPDPALDCRNAPLAAGRKMLNLFNGLVSPNSLKTTDFSNQGKPSNENSTWHDIWTHEFYYLWIKKFAYLDVIYDEIESYMIYFYPLKGKIEEMNEFVQKNNLGFAFEFKRQSEIIFGNEIEKEISEIFDFEEHIKKTLEFRSNPYSNGKQFYLFLDNRQYVVNPEKPYIPSDCLFPGLYRKNFENWKCFHVGMLEFPDEEILQHTKCLFFPGSGSSSYNTDEWIVKLASLIKHVYENTSIKMVGICFGAQLIAQTLGGNVDIMEGRKTDKFFYFHDVEYLNITEEAETHPYFKKLNKKEFKNLSIFEAHGDNIVKPPINSAIIASSKTCPVEVYLENNGRLMGFQGHPEYDVQFCARKGQTFLYAIMHSKYSFEECGEKIRSKITSDKCDCDEWREIIFDFVKSN